MSKSLIKVGAASPMYDSEMNEEDYKAHADCETLANAYKIKNDKTRYKAAVAYAKKKMTTLEEVVDDK